MTLAFVLQSQSRLRKRYRKSAPSQKPSSPSSLAQRAVATFEKFTMFRTRVPGSLSRLTRVSYEKPALKCNALWVSLMYTLYREWICLNAVCDTAWYDWSRFELRRQPRSLIQRMCTISDLDMHLGYPRRARVQAVRRGKSVVTLDAIKWLWSLND